MTYRPISLDLRPDRLLLNPSFDGYKLCLDSFPIYKKKIESGILTKEPDEDQYSFCHVKLFSLHNHLYTNPHSPQSVYVVDKNWEVFKIVLLLSNQIALLNVAYQILKPRQILPGSYNVSMLFPSNDSVVISDGSGAVYLVKISENQDAEFWHNSVQLCQEEIKFVLCDANISNNSSNYELNILCTMVDEKPEKVIENDKTGLFQTLLYWKTFIKNENCDWKEKCHKILSVNGSIDYAAFESGARSIYVISDNVPKWVFDSEKSVNTSENVEDSNKLAPKKKLYEWTQKEEEIIMWVILPQVVKSDVKITITDLKIEIKVKDEIFLSGEFFDKVDKDTATWSLEKNKLEIQLFKNKEIKWESLLIENDQGEEILNPKIVSDIHEKIAHLCSDQEEGGHQSVFNSQQLEECDAMSCDSSSLVRIDGENHLVTHQVSLSSSQWLFKVTCKANETPAICCRHDVDACIWQFRQVKNNEKIWPHEHIGTFSAFGYVQASKTQKKFLVSAPDLSYVAICEASHHIYIYRQPSTLSTELKNRHTGKITFKISKQQLVNIDSREQILGVHATNNLLYVLLENSINILVINSQNNE